MNKQAEMYEERIAALRGALEALASSGLVSPNAAAIARQAIDNDSYAERTASAKAGCIMKSVIETAGHGTYGPFRDEKTAADWANTHVKDATWRLIKLREPAGLTREQMGMAAEAA